MIEVVECCCGGGRNGISDARLVCVDGSKENSLVVVEGAVEDILDDL